MLCCKPKKNQYDVDEAESETEKKNKKSKPVKKGKNKEKPEKTDNDEHSAGVAENKEEETIDINKDTNKTKEEELKVSEEIQRPNTGEGQENNGSIVVSERLGVNDIEEVIDKSKAVTAETGVNILNAGLPLDDQAKQEEAQSKNQSNANHDNSEACSERASPVQDEVELVKETTESGDQCPKVETVKQSQGFDVGCKDDNVSKLQENSETPTKLQDQTEASLVEQLVTQSGEGSEEGAIMSAPEMQAVINRLEVVATKLENLSGSIGGGGAGGGVPPAPDVVSPWVLAYDDLMNGEFAKYLDYSSKIGGDVQTQANMVKTGFQCLRDFLVIVSKSKKPSQSDLMELLTPISNQITSVQEFREKNRGSKMFNHLSGISESIPALGWVTVAPTPGPYVKEMSDAGMFYTNRVVKEFKEIDQMHVDWTKAWLGTLREIQAYIKDHHTTGVSWNPQGGDAKSAAGAKAPPAPGGAPPPPPPGPPPPPPPPVMDVGGASDGGGEQDARAALFADLNKGEGVTSGLKKVTDDMKTHKNPALRKQGSIGSGGSGVRAGPAPFKASAGPPKPAPKPNKNAAPAAKPPVFELQMKKWVIEYQVGNKTMVIDDTNIKQTVYMYKCENSTLQIKGKVNSITLDSCKKVAIAFDDVVSSIEFVNSQSIQAQVMGKCPTVSIDKTDGCQMYLSKDSLDAEIVTAKSSEMNILVPKDDGDFEEFPLPEQYKTLWNGKKFVTNVAESV